jgi:hypothetical protein
MTSRTTRRAEIAAKIAELSEQQAKAVANATYLGWRADERAAYDARSDRLALLRGQLAPLTDDKSEDGDAAT